ncbi:MAG: histidine phosphatase family protein [Acidobacteriaceae bacterium]
MPGKAPKIMVIRHGEKPNGAITGVKASGEPSARDLTVRGWQRAGALACLFAPARGALQNDLLAKPAFIFASAAVDAPEGGNSRSRRSYETVMPLAELLGIGINLSFSKGDEKALAKAAQACDGPVLIAWQHENIGAIVNFILGAPAAPSAWPAERFDVVYVLSLNPADDKYSLAQVPQCLLAGDSANPV